MRSKMILSTRSQVTPLAKLARRYRRAIARSGRL
jgi:hypothetical protein